jgi:hypothetical protein
MSKPEEKTNTNKIDIQLGDIIEVIAPSDPALNNHTFYIKFLDKHKIVLVENTGTIQTLTLSENGKLDNESITGIDILSRAESSSYAVQHDLIPGKWIDIYFGGDVPTIITGEVTNLEEDMIEITTYPEKDVIFIDFAYKGIPEDIPIIKINLRKPPAGATRPSATGPSATGSSIANAITAGPSASIANAITAGPSKKYIPITSLEDVDEDEDIDAQGEDFTFQTDVQAKAKTAAQIRDLFISADQIQFGSELDEVTQVIDLPESEQRYSLEKQTTDLLDELLSTIPNIKRTDSVLNNIHTMIERFKQLRKRFSVFDKDGNLIKPKLNGADYKPLVDSLLTFNQKLYWLLPVVKNIKKIYDYDNEGNEGSLDYDDIIPLTLAETRTAEEGIIDEYKSGNVPDQTNKYAYLLRSLNPYMTPYENNINNSDLATLKVSTNIAAIVDNLGDFYSSVMANNKETASIMRRRFVMQEYNLGISGLDVTKFRGGETIIHRKKLTENDTMTLKSLLLLPEVTVRFSKINLPYTNILMKANLNDHFLNYWQFLNKNTKVKNTVIEQLDEPVNYEKEGFLKKTTDISLAASIENTSPDVYNKYLNTVVPKTRFLFNMIKPYINDNLTLHDVITYLEPFMIYQEDVSFMQYQDMSNYISEKITERKKEYLLKVREYNTLKMVINVFRPKLANIFDTNNALKEAVLSAYGLTDANLTNLSSEEFIAKVIGIDCGRLYNTAIALVGSNLMIANGLKELNDIEKYVKNAKREEVSSASSKCKSYTTIAKRYIALDELQEDNNKDIYFDKKYDTTYYDLMVEYKKPDVTMSNEAYIGFLIDNLMKKNGLTEGAAKREALALLEGKRVVEDGDYAILENGTAEADATLSIEYYRRQNNAWVKDDTISDDVFDDKLKMICNLDTKCLETKGKCDTLGNSGNVIKDNNLKLVLKEFDEQLSLNKAVIVKTINDDLADAMKRITTLLDLIHNQTYKNNYNQYNLGISIEETDSVRSPYIKLRDIILGQADYVKRQQDIIKFVNHFTREALTGVQEDPYWLYCTKTNTKLLPTFLSRLADAFIMKEDYIGIIEQICKDQGKLSDDGDSWVDKYSGYIIRKITLSTEEDYTEEGYKNITRSVLEADVGDAILKLNKAQQTFVDPETEKISNIITTISNFMGINMDAYKEFILRNVRILLDTKMASEEVYNKLLAQAIAKGKKNSDNYETAYYQFLIFSTLSYFFIAIQAAIPSIMTRKTHPGCVRSFSGYPMGGAEDFTGITYLACIVHKIKSPIAHWKSIQSMNIAMITKRIEMQISKFIIQTEEVKQLIKLKENYVLINAEENIPDEHNIANMRHFLPPLVSIKMPSTIQNVTEAFNKELVEALRKGSAKQNEMLYIIRGKITQFTFGIIEMVQKIVHKKAAIMTNSQGEPFLENACCDTSGKTGTLQYFIAAQPDIATYNERIKNLVVILADIMRMGKAGIYYDPRDTKNVIPALNSDFSEETIYSAFIVFCKYGSNLPISEELRAICMNKPEDFNTKTSLAEQIRRLKNDGRNYSQETFQHLLTLVNKGNIVNSHKQTVVKAQEQEQASRIESIKDLIESLEHRNVVNIPIAFTEKFKRLLDTYQINDLVEDTAEMRALQNYLGATNDLMVSGLNEFVKRSPAIKKEEYTFIKECIDSISDFLETGDNMVIESQDETVFKMMTFIKNSLRCLTREFPNIIINKVDNANVVIPKHWGLSERHTADIRTIIDNHYVSLNEFYNDEDIKVILQKYMQQTRDTELLAKLAEYYVPLKMGENKYIYSTMERRLVVRLFKFYFYSTLTDLVALKDDDDVLLRKRPVKMNTSNGYADMDADADINYLTSTENAFAMQNGDITELDIVRGEKKDISDKIARLLNAFMRIICNDKKVINYNYKSMMDKILRSKEKEKDDITSHLKDMSDEEREVENIFKNQKLDRWSKGLQKGLVSYQKETYDEERAATEKQMIIDNRLGKNKDVSEMNKDMYAFDLLEEEQVDAEIEDETSRINYLGEDADFEEAGLDGDEEFL